MKNRMLRQMLLSMIFSFANIGLYALLNQLTKLHPP